MVNTLHKPMALRIRADLFAHLAGMEKAGLPVNAAFALLRLPDPAQARLDVMRRLLAAGADPASAGEKSGLFTKLEAALLRAALSAGRTAIIYHGLADAYKQKTGRAQTIRSRMVLPIFVFVVALFVEPLSSLITGSLTIGGYLVKTLRPLVAFAGLFYLVRSLPHWFARGGPTSTRSLTERLMLRVPVLGTMLMRQNARDFFESLGLMLDAGIPMLDALPKAVDTITVSVIRGEFARIKPRVARGATLVQAVSNLGYLGNDQVLEYIRTGEHSGSLAEMLLRHAGQESAAVSLVQQQVADWLPRVVYGVILLWMAYGLLA